MNALILALVFSAQCPTGCACAPALVIAPQPPTTTVETTDDTTRRHPALHALKAIGKGVNHLRPFRRGRRGC